MILRLNSNNGQSGFPAVLAFALASLVTLPTAGNAAISYVVPDTWTRDNSATTTFAGWDVLTAFAAHPNPPGGILDDNTPEIGLAVGMGHAGLSYRIYQGNGGLGGTDATYGLNYGHRSGSGNYYSGFGSFDYMNDTITGTTRGDTGGFTTIILQIKGQANNFIPNIAATISGSSTFTEVKHLHDLGEGAAGVHWYEWTASGANLDYAINMTSEYSSVGIDSFVVDTFWTPGASAVTSNVTAAPEPTRGLLLLAGLGCLVLRRRRRVAPACNPELTLCLGQ